MSLQGSLVGTFAWLSCKFGRSRYASQHSRFGTVIQGLDGAFQEVVPNPAPFALAFSLTQCLGGFDASAEGFD